MMNVIGLGAIAGLIPVYLGILAALFLGKVLPIVRYMIELPYFFKLGFLENKICKADI